MGEPKLVALDRWASRLRGASECVITISELRVNADIGVNAEEVGRLQPLEINIEMLIDMPQSDSIHETLDYRSVQELAHDLASQRTGLIETFAKRLADSIMESAMVRRVSITVRKPRALLGCVAGCRITIARE